MRRAVGRAAEATALALEGVVTVVIWPLVVVLEVADALDRWGIRQQVAPRKRP